MRKERLVSRSCKRTEKTKEHEGDDDINCSCCAQYSHHKSDTGTGRLGNKRRNGDHPNYSIIKIGQNTERSPRDLMRLAVTPVENHQLTLL